MQSCCALLGSHNLGANFVLLEGDRLEDKVIIYCSNKKEKCCTGGVYVIPKYENHYNEQGAYAEYVELAKSDGHLIIAKTIQLNNSTESYWIIDKNFELPEKFMDWPLEENIAKEFDVLIQSQVMGPMNLDEFNKKLHEINASIAF